MGLTRSCSASMATVSLNLARQVNASWSRTKAGGASDSFRLVILDENLRYLSLSLKGIDRILCSLGLMVCLRFASQNRENAGYVIQLYFSTF